MTIAVIIPALDEERSIGAVLDAIDRELVRDVIVADNGSRDATGTIAAEHGARVIRVDERGYGAACAEAVAHLADDIEIVVFVDADGSDDLDELPQLVVPILADDADLVIGSRALGVVEPGAMTPPQRAGNWIATRLIDLLFHHRYTDLGPFRAVRREFLSAMKLEDRRYGWTVEMQIRALQLGGRVIEVPVRYKRRIGRSKISGTVTGVIKAGFWIVYTIAKYVRRP